jgi:Mrp family chromosome partitioning ATPase
MSTLNPSHGNTGHGEAPARPYRVSRSSRLGGRAHIESERSMGARVVDIPSQPMTNSPILPTMPRELVETIHYLIARLQLSDDDGGIRQRIAVVSASHGEGVTTVARSLAATLANDLDAQVCLVELGSVPTGPLTAAATSGGIVGVINGDMSLDRALVATADPRLFTLSVGTTDRDLARDVLRAPQLASLFAKLDEQFHYVIFDVPPVLTGSHALGLVRHAEAYLLVVRHGVTTVEQVRAATDELRSLNCLGVVMNQYSTRIPKRLRRFFAS